MASGQNGRAQVKIFFFLIQSLSSYLNTCYCQRLSAICFTLVYTLGTSVGDFLHRLSDLKISWLFWTSPKHSHAPKQGSWSPTGVITALAVAVGLLAVALLFSIGVVIHRRRGRYSREV